MNNFYVYRYIRLDTNTPFYVGKGSGKRAVNMSNHNKYCKRIAATHGYRVEKMINKISETLAFAKEVEFISLYKNLGYCEANFTDGGEGASGRIVTEEAIKNMIIAQNNPEALVKRSKNMKKMHQDPEFKKKHREATKKAANRPEVIAKKSKASKIALNKPEVKAKISKKSKETSNRPEVRAKKSASLKITMNRPEMKAKMSKISKEFQNRPEVKAKKSKNMKKIWEERLKDKPFNVYIAKKISHGVYEKDEFVNIYYKQRNCAEELKIDFRNISVVLNGKRPQHKGYIFEYCKESQ